MSKRARVDDAYGDLAGARIIAEEGRKDVSKMLEEAVAKEAVAMEKVAGLEEKVESLKMEKRVWTKQKGILLHNLGSIYKTAKAEISRKDALIARLRSEVEKERGKSSRQQSFK